MKHDLEKMNYRQLTDLADRLRDRDVTFFIVVSIVHMAAVLVAYSLWSRVPVHLDPPCSVMRSFVAMTGLMSSLFAWGLTRGKPRETMAALNVTVQTCIFCICLSSMIIALYLS